MHAPATLRPLLITTVICVLCFVTSRITGQNSVQKEASPPLVVTVHTERVVGQFRPSEAMGAGVDGHERGSIDQMHTPANMKAMVSAGFKPLSYRLRTELAGEAWHWNPVGTWSDASHKRGYWTSSATPGASIQICNGYRLPRRGNSIDQATNKGYSRLTDGDTRSFWKSNPYLDRHFTGEDNARHPQWVVLDLRKTGPINAIRLLWGTPYATHYSIDYFTGLDPIMLNEHETSGSLVGRWEAFAQGVVRNGKGGDVTISFASRPVSVRFLRILMTSGSGTVPTNSTDVRDGLGYALREVYVGTQKAGRFKDLLKHTVSAETQTLAYTSSTDSWHTEADRDPDIEQPGFDRIFRGPLTNRLPVMVPVAPLYDTPENAVAEIKYLKASGYPISCVEMGEEPDGQSISPEDYAALYMQFADNLHAVDSTLKLGGPGFQTNVFNYVTWPDAQGDNSWYHRFVQALQVHGRTSDLRFFSFEWYPFDNVCDPTAPQLAAAPAMLSGLLGRLKQSGLSPEIPWIISEYGYSSSAGAAEVDMAGAILNTEIVAQFLTLGGKTAYLYGYEPVELMKETRNCISWGNLTLFQSDEHNRILRPLAAYYGARLLTQEWVQSGDGLHALFVADCALKNAAGHPLITSYAVRRPDKTWSLLLLNKDPKQPHTVQIAFQGKDSRRSTSLTGPVTEIQYSSQQYVWHAKGKTGYAQPNLPPAKIVHPIRNEKRAFTLPPYSITVLLGKGAD